MPPVDPGMLAQVYGDAYGLPQHALGPAGQGLVHPCQAQDAYLAGMAVGMPMHGGTPVPHGTPMPGGMLPTHPGQGIVGPPAASAPNGAPATPTAFGLNNLGGDGMQQERRKKQEEMKRALEDMGSGELQRLVLCKEVHRQD